MTLLLNKDTLDAEEEMVLQVYRLELDQMYNDLAKGAYIRSRAKWVEEGEKNTSYFFALEKRNYKRKSMSALNINGKLCKHPMQISEHVYTFYKNLYDSNFNEAECNIFMKRTGVHVTNISDDFKKICEADLLIAELRNAIKV